MIEIIEHKDYNKPVDNETVVEVPTTNNQTKKLFKVFDGIWLDPTSIIIKQNIKEASQKLILPPYMENYYKSTEQKSKYLEQMTILFQRINSTPLGKSLLLELSKGSPINFNQNYTWNITNMVKDRTNDNILNRRLRATCIIKPTSEYLRNFVNIESTMREELINTEKRTLFFNPDCIFSVKRGGIINYFDPSVALFHELVHITHYMYGTLGLFGQEEEYVTFGSTDGDIYVDDFSNNYTLKSKIILKNLKLLQRKVNSIVDPIDREYFQEKYQFIENKPIDEYFCHDYLIKFQDNYSEYLFVKTLNIQQIHRNSYEEKLFLAFKLDISDPKIYTAKEGFLKPSNTIKEITSQREAHLLVNINSKQALETLNHCLKKSFFKRSIDYEPVPLEETNLNKLGNEKITKKKAIIKRETIKCQKDFLELLEDLDTVYEKSKEIPRRILGKYAKKNETIVVNYTLLNKAPELSENVSTEYMQELETFQQGELVGVDRITATDIWNAHRFNHDIINQYNIPLEFVSENINHAINLSNITYTPNKNISTKMQLMNSGKAVLKTGNAIVNIAQFGMWVDEIVEDFKGNTGKDNLHIANDVLSIVPYLGQVMNIGVDITNKDYLGAVETLGILVLLEVFPELMLPIFLTNIFVSVVLRNKIQKEMVSKAVWNILMERDQLLDSQLETEAKSLAHICIERIQKIANHVEQQLTFTVNGILHNLNYYSDKKFKADKNNQEIQKIIFNARKELFKGVETKKKKIIETLFNALKKTILKDYKEKTKGQIDRFNEGTKAIIKNIIKEHSSDISNNILDQALQVVQKHIDQGEITKTIQHELNSLSSMLEAGIEIVLHQSGNPLIYSHIGLNKYNKAIDKLTSKEVTNQNISYAWGRNGNALKFKAGESLPIEAKLFSHINIFTDFTIEFWIKVPSKKNHNSAPSKEIPIIRNGIKNILRWAFILNDSHLKFIVYLKDEKKFILGNVLIANNKWTKITLINNSKTKMMSFFINENLINEENVSWILPTQVELITNNIINIGLPKDANFFFMIDDFKLYMLALNDYQVYASYNADKDPELLYDYFGNCLKKDREYVLAVYDVLSNQYYPVTKSSEFGCGIYNINDKEDLHNYDFTVKFSAENVYSFTKTTNRNVDIIYNNDNIIVISEEDQLILGYPISYELWAIDEDNNKKYYLHVNNNVCSFNYKRIYGFSLDFATNHNSYCTFKIFSAFDYATLSDNFNNKNAISLALYGEGNILRSLFLAHDNKILAIDNILKNKNSTDDTVILSKFHYNIINDINDYIYKSIFYLIPVDELEYY